jgi:hypothetical protein
VNYVNTKARALSARGITCRVQNFFPSARDLQTRRVRQQPTQLPPPTTRTSTRAALSLSLSTPPNRTEPRTTSLRATFRRTYKQCLVERSALPPVHPRLMAPCRRPTSKKGTSSGEPPIAPSQWPGGIHIGSVLCIVLRSCSPRSTGYVRPASIYRRCSMGSRALSRPAGIHISSVLCIDLRSCSPRSTGYVRPASMSVGSALEGNWTSSLMYF